MIDWPTAILVIAIYVAAKMIWALLDGDPPSID